MYGSPKATPLYPAPKDEVVHMAGVAMAVGEGAITVSSPAGIEKAGFLYKNFDSLCLRAETLMFYFANRCIPDKHFKQQVNFQYVTYADGAKTPLFGLLTTGSIEFTNLAGTTCVVSSRCASAMLSMLTVSALLDSAQITEDQHEKFCDQHYLLFEAGREFAKQDGCANEFTRLTK
jgi:hypothetical protein